MLPAERFREGLVLHTRLIDATVGLPLIVQFARPWDATSS